MNHTPTCQYADRTHRGVCRVERTQPAPVDHAAIIARHVEAACPQRTSVVEAAIVLLAGRDGAS